MALRKVIGTETEFGITVLNQAGFNPVVASSAVVNAYAGNRFRIRWSFDEESPGRDLRERGDVEGPGIDFETALVNTVLTNGARFYVDHAHPEYSSPECTDPRSAALYDKAGERVLLEAAAAAQELLGVDERLIIHKNNTDGKGNSYGFHENYLIARSIPFDDIVRQLTAFFVTRQVFTGSGKVGSENGRPSADYQITQRADFFEEEVGLETTLKRPIINTRDEPHADPARYRRLHVIVGDANRSEIQTFLKLGTTALVLDAIEDGALSDAVELVDPVHDTWSVSHDPTLRYSMETVSGGKLTALEIQWEYLRVVREYAIAKGVDPIWMEVLEEWETILVDLDRDPLTTADRLDWTAKLRILEGYRTRDGLSWNHPKLRLLDLQYHDVNPDRSLYQRLVDRGAMRRLFNDREVEVAIAEPPDDTRAYFRGTCVGRYPDALVAANWDSLVFDVGEETLKRVPMMEPLRGTRDLVATMLDASPTAATMIRALGGNDG
ncbi:MAG: depupylase/deamidase Dop [Actinomycetota bacterium]|nr:depupylase/deamidase Dop [Actinomycetota bacterium]